MTENQFTMEKRSYRIDFESYGPWIQQNYARLPEKTEGGDGDEALFVSWEERDETRFFA